MMKFIAIVSCIALAACAIHDPNDISGKLNREFKEGERLMNDCNQKNKRCPDYFKFKREFEASINNYTTFENALKNHKARVARGGDW